MITGIKKLAIRERIVVVVMAVVILYGAFNFLFGGPAKRPSLPSAVKAPDLKTLTSNVTTAMSRDMLSVHDAYVIARAEAEWLHDPFFERKAYREMLNPPKELPKVSVETKEHKETKEPKKVVFNYTGYMEFKGKKVAIVNGAEYTTGEALETPGYVLRAIASDKIVIENKEGKTSMEVPIQD